jgi:hypothetical protein
MINTLATTVAEKIKIVNMPEESGIIGRWSNKFWLLAAVPATLAVVGGSYLLIRRRWHR